MIYWIIFLILYFAGWYMTLYLLSSLFLYYDLGQGLKELDEGGEIPKETATTIRKKLDDAWPTVSRLALIWPIIWITFIVHGLGKMIWVTFKTLVFRR